MNPFLLLAVHSQSQSEQRETLVYVEHANSGLKGGFVEENAFRILQVCKTIQATSVSKEISFEKKSIAALKKHGLITETVEVG